MAKKYLSKTSLCKKFGQLPDETDYDYELELTKIVNTVRVREKELKDILYQFRADHETGKLHKGQKDIAYAAYYCLNIFYRHSLDSGRFEELSREYQDLFYHHATFRYLDITCEIHNPEKLQGREKEYLTELYQHSKKYPLNAGYAHGFAHLYAQICEQDYSRQETFRKKWEGKAKKQINLAISINPNYALYYCTKGRIALISGDYTDADSLFDIAINKEDSSRKDGYGIIISRYQSYKLQARTLAFSDHVREQVEDLQTANISNIEVLSFFAAIVSFILGSFSLAQGQTTTNAAVLIVILMGALLVVFSSFCFLLHLNTARKFKIYAAYIIVELIGAAIVIGGFCFVS